MADFGRSRGSILPVIEWQADDAGTVSATSVASYYEGLSVDNLRRAGRFANCPSQSARRSRLECCSPIEMSMDCSSNALYTL